ncbi:hypothetical protein AYO48_02440 [Gaiella sp. SCGC AG-212-M14]|nr:hypothetical protein AYO48_02440 [Gaiella sp. SCGC AG-212-M14]
MPRHLPLGARVLLAVAAAGAIGALAVGGDTLRAAYDGKQGTTRASVRTAGTRKAPRYRYIFFSDKAAAKVASYGWNLIDVDSKELADGLPKGTRGLIWIGDYDNVHCSWEQSDAAITKKIKGMVGDPKVAGYVFSDEPDPFACRSAIAQHKSRSALIHSLDPAKFDVVVIDTNSAKKTLDQIPMWVGVADYTGLNTYPCYYWTHPCDFAWIDKVIAVADKVGLSYWGGAQATDDGKEWRWPTPAEEQHMLNQWAASKQSGYLTFAWKWAGKTLTTRPGLLAVFKRFNKPPPTRAPKRAPKVVLKAATASEIHYTFLSRTSVAFDWSGNARTIRYGRTAAYGAKVNARRSSPAPVSSRGPFWEAKLTALAPGATYHYSIGGQRDHTFVTAPIGSFRFDVEADVGDTGNAKRVGPTQAAIASDKPAFVLVPGDLTYANDNGQAAVDGHFRDVMVWSRSAAYMPAWGNHEWDSSGDDLRNYKGRFAIPHAHGSPGSPSKGCCGEDWGWFDAGPVRFISYPEPYTDATWTGWRPAADSIMAAAQADRKIKFIVTFGHRPAYSSGYHAGEETLASILDTFGDRYSKYVLNFNGHSHDYERFRPIHHVVHITGAGGGSDLEPWGRKDTRTAYRAMHLEHLRVTVSAKEIRVQAICGPSTPDDNTVCRPGDVIDSVTIPAP